MQRCVFCDSLFGSCDIEKGHGTHGIYHGGKMGISTFATYVHVFFRQRNVKWEKKQGLHRGPAALLDRGPSSV